MFEINPDGKGLTKPGDNTPERAEILAKTTNYLFDNLALANDKFFRKLAAGAITDPEYGQIQILAAANFLRYIIHTNVAKESVNEVVDNVMLGLKEAPPRIERPENADIDARNAQLQAANESKIIVEDEIEAPHSSHLITPFLN